MEQLEFFTVPNPCVGVCTVDSKGYCQGCMRKRSERFEWLSMTPAQQLNVIRLCRQRYRRILLKTKQFVENDTESGGKQGDLFD